MTTHISGHDVLHFSHANGFPAGSYQAIFERLSVHYDVRTIDRLGHNPQYPVTNNWRELAKELTHHFEQNYRQPVIAVGHSLGGVLSYMVAQQRPDLVKALIMLDSPILTPMQSVGFGVMKRLGLSDYFTPAARTEGRRSHWESVDDALAYFSGKTLMKNFDPRCLKDYVSAGTEMINPDRPEDGIRLRFDPDTEIKIYRTIPHDIRCDAPLNMPTAVIGGRQSNVFLPINGARMQSRVGMKVKWVPGGHLFPFEHPTHTADHIHHLLSEMLS
ncbi:alpha/beta fold hydrolase [Bacterioplanoides sp. SCSIO 12839]|uniref:alpha/beta fold hydrolase n=1 Tax=Bacterioplanoides sp. SCSIO 12839 TaxID=2829569 RepID=UPI002105B3AB|nr:alpha/beta hydrolase [Bacterioplanoides sp. SCSIO 12839]UTW46803.1 alpha/beta hydrolase [Bacterioplanoides sp. SCSIO 12839]